MDIKLGGEEDNEINDENKACSLRPSPLKISRNAQNQEPPNFKSPRSPPPRRSIIGENEKVVTSVKSVLIGDAKIGKTSLVNSFLFEEFNKNYMSTVRDDFTFCTTMAGFDHVDGVANNDDAKKIDVDLDILDTGGQTYLDRLRPLCYGDGITSTDVAIICFSVVVPSSFTNVTKRWVPELKRHCLNFNKNMKTILVGTQSDLRSNVNILLNLMEDGLAPISETRATRLAKKIGALKYLECSSFTGLNVKRVFDTVIYSKVAISSPPPLLRTDAQNNNILAKFPNSPTSPGPTIRQPLSSKTNRSASSSSLKLNTNDPRLFSWKKCRLRQKSSKIKRLMLSCLR